MSTTHSRADGSRLVLLTASALILGIFGMNTLGLHCPGLSHAAAMPLMSSASGVVISHVDTAGHAAPPSRAGLAVDDRAAPAMSLPAATGHGGTNGGPGELVSLCVALLAAAAGAFLVLLALRRAPRMWAVVCSAITKRITGCIQLAGTGPPPVWKFSVIRC